MQIYDEGIYFGAGIREHPWTQAEYEEGAEYIDFRKEPDKICTHLEDFKHYDYHPAVKQFYTFLKWLNTSEESIFESNDCQFIEPQENTQKDIHNKGMVSSGRLMFFFRDLHLNISPESRIWGNIAKVAGQQLAGEYAPSKYTEWLRNQSETTIKNHKSGTDPACLATVLFPTCFLEAPGEKIDKIGYEMSLRYWVWGDDENEILENFGHVVTTIHDSLKSISANFDPSRSGLINTQSRLETVFSQEIEAIVPPRYFF